ncbi:hypothetical protein FA15DRAFT_589233 [Coprinopsis marcescibilis]|nr:hypothetical protein FA15DRAFT_589233 [Coprinopsis marcescibilis]
MLHPTFILLSTLLGSAYAANDWSKPCLSGVCFYDLPSSQAQASSGTLKIWGSPDAITDITSAAGWQIIDCSPTALAQDIRLVCTDPGDARCAHLYQNVGAEGKIVRLPEDCGSNAFAHISRAWDPEDQSIPSSIAKRLVRRDGEAPQVRALRIDTDFAKVDTARSGPVNFAIAAANVPGAQDIVSFPGPSSSQTKNTKRGNLSKRNIFSKAKDFVKGAAEDVGDFVSGAVGEVVEVAENVGNAVGDFVQALNQANEISIDESKTLDPFVLDQTFNVLDQEISCPPITASLKIDVQAKARALATVGVAAQGTIVPPKVDEFAVTATISGNIDGSVTLNANVAGSLESPELELFQIGIPGLDFPGYVILTIGPSFSVSAQATADLELSGTVTVGLSYTFDKATLVFPPNAAAAQAQDGAFKLGDTPLKLSVAPEVKATGTIEAHLIPSLNLGISALGDVAEAQVFLNLDASAGIRLELEASAEVGVVVNNNGQQGAPQGQTQRQRQQRPRALAIRGSNNYFDKRQTAAAVNDAGFGGCFEIIAGLDVNVGANADFFGLFNAETSVSLFSKEFELFRRCFGNQAGTRRSMMNRRSINSRIARGTISSSSTSSVAKRTLEKRVLACPVGVDLVAAGGDQAQQQNLVDEVVPAAK